MAKDTHVTKDGRTVKKGLYYYMNRAKKAGKSLKGKDYDHKTKRFTSVRANRGNRGHGTRNE